jgi:DNA-binding NtrC family response regulator
MAAVSSCWTFERNPPRKVIIMTGHSGVKSLIVTMAGEGVMYMKKPIEPRELLTVLSTLGDDSSGGSADGDSGHFGLLLGESPGMHAVYKQIRQVGVTDSTVLIRGESGTGKELVAEAIHRVSTRQGRFIPVNCGGLARDLIASQLFGHEKGSFTGADRRHAGYFERADGGALFLDEITEMPLEMQTIFCACSRPACCCVGAEREIPVSARLVAATNRDPAQAARWRAAGRPLFSAAGFRWICRRSGTGRRHPASDGHFLAELNARNDLTRKGFFARSPAKLEQHQWPGNVRELKHDSTCLHHGGVGSCRGSGSIRRGSATPSTAWPSGGPSRTSRRLILSTLEHFGGDKKQTAATLEVSIKTLYNRLKSYESAN